MNGSVDPDQHIGASQDRALILCAIIVVVAFLISGAPGAL